MTGTMLGFPGEDYTTQESIKKSGGFGDPATRPERLQRFQWALERTLALGLTDLMLHAGFLPEPGAPTASPSSILWPRSAIWPRPRESRSHSRPARKPPTSLRRTLDDLKCPNLKVNFDPANMLLYEKGDPIRAVEILAPDIRSVHVKDAVMTKVPGTWGDEVPLGKGDVNIQNSFSA